MLAEQLDTLNFLWTFTRLIPVMQIDKKTSAFITVQRESSFLHFRVKGSQQLGETGIHKSILLMYIYIDSLKHAQKHRNIKNI